VNNHLCVLRKLLNLAVGCGELSHAPRVKQLRVAHGDFQFLTFEETPRFLQAAAPEWKAFVRIALKTGLRVGELLAVRWEDLDLVAGRLVVRRTLWSDQEGTPKGGRTRKCRSRTTRSRRSRRTGTSRDRTCSARWTERGSRTAG
jgi:integrase